MKSEIDNVLALGDLHKMPHFKVYVGNSAKGPVYCSSEAVLAEKTSITWDSSKPILEAYLNRALPGTYLIHYKTDPDEKLKIYSMTFQITPATAEAAIAGQTGLSGGMPLSIMENMMNRHFDTQIGKVTENFQHQLEVRDLKREIEELKKKKTEKNSSLSWNTLIEKGPELIDKFMESAAKIKAMKNEGGTQIAIGTSSHKIPANAANKSEKAEEVDAEEDEEEFNGFHLAAQPKLVKVYQDTMTELIKSCGGDHCEAVIFLYGLNELRKEKEELFNAFVVPEIKKHKEALNERIATA